MNQKIVNECLVLIFYLGSESKRSMMVISILIRSLIDFSVIDTKPYMESLVEKFHQRVAEKFEEALSTLMEVFAWFLFKQVLHLQKN